MGRLGLDVSAQPHLYRRREEELKDLVQPEARHMDVLHVLDAWYVWEHLHCARQLTLVCQTVRHACSYGQQRPAH